MYQMIEAATDSSPFFISLSTKSRRVFFFHYEKWEMRVSRDRRQPKRYGGRIRDGAAAPYLTKEASLTKVSKEEQSR
jgi:hypothetical protein